MKVLLGTCLGMTAGGVRSHLDSLRHALTLNDIHSELVCADNVSVLWKFEAALRALGSVDRARVELTKMRTGNAGEKARKAISQQNFDLLHTHDVHLANWATRLPIPTVLTVHGPASREALMLKKGTPAYLRYLRKVERQAYESARSIIAVDDGQKEIIVSDYQICPRKVTVIQNAVDTDFFMPIRCKSVGHPFLFVPRRLVPKNGVQVAVKAFRLIADMDVELWIGGDGPERPYLEKLVGELDLTSKVRFLGVVDRNEIVRLMNSCRGVIIPSTPVKGVIEATSIAALEGMSMAKPVFASNVGGLGDIVRNDDTGFLVEAGDDMALGNLLRKALMDEERLRTVGKKAREHVVRNHSLKVWIEQVLGVYRDALQPQGT